MIEQDEKIITKQLPTALDERMGSPIISPYYQDERCTIYHGDCLEIMKSIAQHSVDLIVTSPPYDNLRKYNGYSWNFERIATELCRIIKPGGVIVWIIGDSTINGSESLSSFKQVIYFVENCGMNLHDTMIYKKNGPAYPSNDKYFQIFEYMFVISMGKPKTFNPINDRKNLWYAQKFSKTRSRRNKDGNVTVTKWDKEQGGEFGKRFNIWKYNVGAGYTTKDEIAYKHPAIFPEQLAKDHIISWSNERDIILDPFCGSGTTLKMAKRLGRIAIGIDISREYCEISKMRVAQCELF